MHPSPAPPRVPLFRGPNARGREGSCARGPAGGCAIIHLPSDIPSRFCVADLHEH
jgi:hypothetical protein